MTVQCLFLLASENSLVSPSCPQHRARGEPPECKLGDLWAVAEVSELPPGSLGGFAAPQ